MFSLLGLSDSYDGDGRAILQVLNPSAIPASLRAYLHTLDELGAAYKQLNAPFGSLGLDSLSVATAGVTSGSASDDATYVATQAQLASWLAQRDQLAQQIAALLIGAEFRATPINQFRLRS